MKLHRKTKKPRLRLNKRNLGRSIEERPKEAEERKEFGHWECDLIIGAKFGQDEALLTLLECKTREFMIVKLPNKSAKSVKSVMTAFETLMDKCGEYFGAVFKTITTDNGSEFAALSSFEKAAETLVYSVHSYTSCDKDSVDRHNGLIRRFISKGKQVDYYTAEDIFEIGLWCNSLPHKILGYHSPEGMFSEALDKIYSLNAA